MCTPLPHHDSLLVDIATPLLFTAACSALREDRGIRTEPYRMALSPTKRLQPLGSTKHWLIFQAVQLLTHPIPSVIG